MSATGPGPQVFTSRDATKAPPMAGDSALAGRSAPVAPLVVGLDLSLVSTGIAHARDGQYVADTIVPPKNRRTGLLRLRWLREAVCEQVGSGAALVVLEGPSYGSVGGAQHDRAGLWWMVTDRLWTAGIPYAVVPPANLKRYATGSGGGPKASKDAVLVAAVRRLPGFDGGNDAADASWLAAMGVDHLTGQSLVPAAHRTGLDKCTWPTVARAA